MKRNFRDISVWASLSRMLKQNKKAKKAIQITLLPNGQKLCHVVIKG